MAEGIFTAVSGAAARQKHLEKVSHNLANADTAGYRARKVAFEERVADAMGLARQVDMAEESVEHSPGTYENTGLPLDVAIEGRGFFMVESEQGPVLTRDGRFRLTAEGKVVNTEGEPVLNRSRAPIWVPGDAEELIIDERGRISDLLGPLDRIGVFDVEDLAGLEPIGPARFASEQAQVRGGATVRQGMIEGGNVDPVEGMTDLIALHRHFDVMQKLMQTHRDMDRRAMKLGSMSG